MLIYHVTPEVNVAGILTNGFIDQNDGQFVDAGVWFADRALIGDEGFADEPGPFGGVSVDLPEMEIAEYEQPMPPGSDRREWHIPHAVVNKYLATVRRIEAYPPNYVQTYDGYWIVKHTEDTHQASIGGGQVQAAIPIYRAVDPVTGAVLAENRRLPELMLSIHNELPRKT